MMKMLRRWFGLTAMEERIVRQEQTINLLLERLRFHVVYDANEHMRLVRHKKRPHGGINGT